MRLRLRVERNELPAVRVLWAISDTELKQTVSKFLERVNERFPLEGDTWGLEDYAVTVGGFEALHFGEVGTCFQNEDEVVVRPLQYAEVRARTITGRAQITEDGRHLIDGVPFGRPLLRRSGWRPEVRIPPRKKLRLENGDAGAGERHEENEEQALVRLEDLTSDEEDEEEEEDMDFEPTGEDDEEDVESDEEEQHSPRKKRKRQQDDAEEQGQPALQLRRSKRRRIIDEAPEELPDDNSSSSSESSSDSSDDDDEDTSSDNSSSESDSDSSDGSEWNGITPSAPQTSTVKPSSASKVQPTQEQASMSDSPPEEESSRSTLLSLPFEGSEGTKARNLRRREQRKLKHLKEAGTLSADSTLTDLQQWQESKGLKDNKAVKAQVQLDASRQRLLDQIHSGGIDITEQQAVNGGRAEDDTRSKEGATLSDARSPKVNGTEGMGDTTTQPPHADRATAEASESLPEPGANQRRARIDPKTTNRLIFGALGQRTPKTQADKDALQKKLAAQPKRNAAEPKPNQVEGLPEQDQDPEAWRTKVDISAVECCDEGVTLTAPPFPFKQRWDPQYQRGRRNKRRAPSTTLHSQKKRKTNATSGGVFVETYDKYNANGNDALDYDDVEEDDLDDEYWEDGALLDGDNDESGFPPLPEDVSSLKQLADVDAMQGDYVVFTELTCSAATGWQPKHLSRTVRLEKKDIDGWQVKFAPRDARPREYDEEGNRIYTKFEMEGMSDDEGEEENKVLLWSAMADPRLLLRE